MAGIPDNLFLSTVKDSGFRALDWVYRFAQDLDPNSREYGGIRNNYDPMRREFRRSGHGLCLTWSACLAGFTGLTAYDLTGDPFYLDRVKLIAEYVKSNQNLDESDGLRCGAFVVSRDRRFIDVPDSSWAGHLFLQLYRRTGEADYLRRARLAADWLLRVAPMPHGGFTTFYLLDSQRPVSYSHASDGQHGLFLGDLYDETGDDKYARPLKPLADMLAGAGQHDDGPYYASLRADGTPVFEGWDEEAGHPLVAGIEKIVTGPRQNYYAAAFLLEQYRRDGTKSYLASALRCARWTRELYRRNGYLAEWLTLNDEGIWESDRPDVASPSATALVWLALDDLDPGAGWLDGCREMALWNLRWQRRLPGHPDLDGAVVATPTVVGYYQSFAAWGMLKLAARLAGDSAVPQSGG
jgi:hypothetical protein